MIEEILLQKRKQLLESGGAQDATFVKSDIDALLNLNELRMFKLKHTFPSDFKFCETKEESIQQVISSDDIYRILEYCVIAQPILQESVGVVFKNNWRFINGRKFATRHSRA